MTQIAKINPSRETILAMFNSMVGGAMLTFPVLFKKAGVAMSSIILLISGLISFITCRIYVIHMSEEDKDVESTIKRILGLKWQKIWRVITGVYLILLCIIYIDLIVDQLYSIIYLIFEKSDKINTIANKNDFQWGKFSTQYLALILFFPLLALVFVKNLNLVVKLSGYGGYSAFIYFFFVIYKFISALANGQININQINWFSSDIGNLSGSCALAFTIHTMVVTFVKPNIKQQNNQRDVGFAYLLGFLLYQIIGVTGAFAISGIKPQICPNTLVQCYITQWLILLVQVSYLFGRITVFPCTLQVSRTRLIELFYGKVEEKQFKIFNICFMIFGTIICILSPYLPLALMMNIIGSVVCYCFIYMIPTLLHYKCLFKRKVDTQQSLVQSITTLQENNNNSNVNCRHGSQYAIKHPNLLRYLLYGVINIIGIALGIYGIYVCVLQIKQNN